MAQEPGRLDPQWFRRWFDTRRLIMDPRVDGLFFFEVSWQDRPWAHYGRYLRAEAPRRLKFTWTSEATQGLESIVNSELGRGHEEGWKAIVAEISRAMEADP